MNMDDYRWRPIYRANDSEKELKITKRLILWFIFLLFLLLISSCNF